MHEFPVSVHEMPKEAVSTSIDTPQKLYYNTKKEPEFPSI